MNDQKRVTASASWRGMAGTAGMDGTVMVMAGATGLGGLRNRRGGLRSPEGRRRRQKPKDGQSRET